MFFLGVKYHRKQWLENASSVRSDVYGGLWVNLREFPTIWAHTTWAKNTIAWPIFSSNTSCDLQLQLVAVVLPKAIGSAGICAGSCCPETFFWRCQSGFLEKKHIGTNWLHQTLVTLFLSMLQSRSILFFSINQSSRSWVSTPGS